MENVKFVTEVAAAVLGAVLTYVAFTLTEDSDPLLHWSVVTALGLLSLVAAALAARSGARVRREQGVAIADRVRTRRGVKARRIDVSGPGSGDVRVATDIRAKRDVRVEDVRVRQGDGEEADDAGA